MKLTFEYKETYGAGDGRAINRHSVKVFHDDHGCEYRLDRTTDIRPRCFEIIGPLHPGFVGIAPTVPVMGQRYFGDDIS